MGKATRTPSSALLGAFAVLGLVIGWGCTGNGSVVARYDFFATPDAGDPWSDKIGYWQARERADRRSGLVRPAASAAVVGAGPTAAKADAAESLEVKYATFRRESKRAMARDLAAWIQAQAQQHYIPDEVVDDWATLDATLRNNGDDCDGLELLVFNYLRDLGFGDDEVYRAIVYRKTDNQHHMVTLWFEDPHDPWVIDPTGAMTAGMPRMSELPDWRPLKVFSEDEEFTVRTEFVASANAR